VARRRMTVKRIDPWSVLKFGVVANLAMLAIGLLVLGVVFFFIDRLRLIDQVCEIALDVGFTACGLNIGNLFRASVLLGLLGVIILTAVLVFFSFLHNLIADLTGGLTISVIDDGPPAGARAPGPGTTTGRQRPAVPTGPATGGTRTGVASSGRPPVAPIGRAPDELRDPRGPGRGRSRAADDPADRTAAMDRTDGDPADRTAAMDRTDGDPADRTAAMDRTDSDELFGGR
jgi:hypothetical protein